MDRNTTSKHEIEVKVMNKIIVVVSNDNECIESLKRAGDSIGVEIKYEIQSQGKIINELSINDIKESTAVLFAIDGEVEDVEKIERFIDCEYYEVEEQIIKNDAKLVLEEILSDLN